MQVNIFRSGMILSNRLHAGQITQADTLTRLLYSILATESAPASFYTQAADDRLHSAHYDGLPSDFVAAAITGIGDSMRPSAVQRSEEHTSELQSLMRISYAVFCLKKKKKDKQTQRPHNKL